MIRSLLIPYTHHHHRHIRQTNIPINPQTPPRPATRIAIAQDTLYIFKHLRVHLYIDQTKKTNHPPPPSPFSPRTKTQPLSLFLLRYSPSMSDWRSEGTNEIERDKTHKHTPVLICAEREFVRDWPNRPFFSKLPLFFCCVWYWRLEIKLNTRTHSWTRGTSYYYRCCCTHTQKRILVGDRESATLD